MNTFNSRYNTRGGSTGENKNTEGKSPSQRQFRLSALRERQYRVQVFDLTHDRVYLLKFASTGTLNDVFAAVKSFILRGYPRGTIYKLHMLRNG